jgi:hypothetical protein
MNENFKRKVVIFNQLLKDAYRDEDERGMFGEELKLSSKTITEDITAMIYAMHVFLRELTGTEEDILGFTHQLNRLVVQQLIGKDSECGK